MFLTVAPSPSRVVLGHRQLGTACTTATGLTNCTVTPTSLPTDPGVCHFGPCGAAVVETWKGTTSHVFHPHPPLTNVECGYDAIDKNPATNNGNPIVIGSPNNELFSDQTPYSGVHSSCPYNICIRGGKPAVEFAITIVSNKGTGSAIAQPWNASFTGPGTANLRLVYPGPVKFTAHPTGPHASLTRVVFSGACESSGALGQPATCKLTPPYPKPAVTIIYACTAAPCLTTTPGPVHP